MATDYDAPRKTEEETNEDSLEELKARRHDKNSGKVDEDEAEAAESFELPGADLSHEELAVEVMPRQDDEVTCMSCFLVHHRSQLADEKKLICRDCAGGVCNAPWLSQPGSERRAVADLRVRGRLSCRRSGVVCDPRRQVAGGPGVVVGGPPRRQHPSHRDDRAADRRPGECLAHVDVG